MARVRVVRSCIIVIIIVVTTTFFTTAISTTMICGGFAHDTHNCGDSHRRPHPARRIAIQAYSNLRHAEMTWCSAAEGSCPGLLNCCGRVARLAPIPLAQAAPARPTSFLVARLRPSGSPRSSSSTITNTAATTTARHLMHGLQLGMDTLQCRRCRDGSLTSAPLRSTLPVSAVAAGAWACWGQGCI